MKKIIALALVGMLTANMAFAAGKSDDVMKKNSDGTYVVNTTTLCKDVKGYAGATPLEVHIKGGKVVKVVPLRNRETPKFFDSVKRGLITKYAGMKVSKASKEVDGVTGATFSSNAVKKNIQAAVAYYKKHK